MVFPVMVLDSSFLVSLFRKDDENNQNAREIMRRNLDEHMLLTDLVLFETLTIIAYKDGLARSKDVYDELVTNRNIQMHSLTQEEKDCALGEFFSQKGKLGAIDVSILHMAKKYNSGILAFDAQLNRAFKKL